MLTTIRWLFFINNILLLLQTSCVRGYVATLYDMQSIGEQPAHKIPIHCGIQ